MEIGSLEDEQAIRLPGKSSVKVAALVIGVLLVGMMSSLAYAVVESVPPASSEWRGRTWGSGSASCPKSYSTLEMAVQGILGCACEYMKSLGWVSSCYVKSTTNLSNKISFAYSISIMGVDANNNIAVNTGDIIDGWVICPVPVVNSTVPYLYNSVTNMCERTLQQTYTLNLSPKTATIEPNKTYSFTATVTNQDGSATSQPVPVSVKVEVDPTSGGHDHGETVAIRPKGNVSPASGSTVLNFTFTAEAVSGAHTITAMCDQCVNKTATVTVEVKVEGLEPIPPGASFYTLVETDGTVIGSTTKHKGNHYLTPEAATILLYMASSYHAEVKYWTKPPKGNKPVPPLPLHLNDASLVWGGKFDVSGRWTGEHAEHKRGTVIDIRANSKTGAIPSKNYNEFKILAKYYGADAKIHSPGEDAQHFHVRLLGKGE